MKSCRVCKQEKNLSEFNKSKANKSGARNECKVCEYAYYKQWRKENKEYKKQKDREWRENNRERYLATSEAYRKANPYKMKEWHAANKDKEKVWEEENKEKRRAVSRKWRKANREYFAKWKRDNIEKVRDATVRRRARLKDAFVADVSRQEIFERDGGKCHICKGFVDPKDWHLEHLVPISKGGTHEPNNVSVSHPKCNQMKGYTGTAQLRLGV